MVEFWTDRKYYKNVTKLTTEIGVSWGEEAKKTGKGPYIRVRKVLAGKFHRYSGWTFMNYIRRFDVTLKDVIWGNFVGFFGFLGGLIMSTWRMIPKKKRPDVIFLKGGFVCLPIGIVAKWLKIPYIIHESDAVPGLANRILMKNAKKVAFGSPLSEETMAAHPNYVWVGIPVSDEFKAVTATKQIAYKKAFSFPTDKPLVVITGGSQGAVSLNNATREILPELLKFTSVALVAGRKNYEDMIDLKRYESWDKAKLESNFRMWEFNTTMNELLGAADLIVSRAGATTIAEMAALKKATILVPFASLPGGHQVKNAERLQESGAVSVLDNVEVREKPEVLLAEIKKLIKDNNKRTEMAEKLHAETKRDAAKTLAEMILVEGK